MDGQTFTHQRSRAVRADWAGIWAGMFAGLGIQIVLAALGLGISLMSSGSSAADVIRSLPTGVEVWTALVWLLSAFLGGYVAAWMSGASSRADGVFHGFVTWGVMVTALLCAATIMTGVMRIEHLTAFSMTSLLKAASWWMFVSGILSLGCAYLGGRVGASAAEHGLEGKGVQRAA